MGISDRKCKVQCYFGVFLALLGNVDPDPFYFFFFLAQLEYHYTSANTRIQTIQHSLLEDLSETLQLRNEWFLL